MTANMAHKRRTGDMALDDATDEPETMDKRGEEKDETQCTAIGLHSAHGLAGASRKSDGDEHTDIKWPRTWRANGGQTTWR